MNETPSGPLHPALEDWVEYDGAMRLLRHPLVYSLRVDETLHAMLNHQYEQKKLACEEALKTKNWFKYIVLHERPWRLWAFQKIASQLDDQEYWRNLSLIWTNTENIHQNQTKWHDVWNSPRGQRECVMDDEDRETLAGLSEQITIYRGSASRKGIRSFSWTVDRERAEWFARRSAVILPDRPKVAFLAQAQVEKKRVLAYFSDRNESEIVVLPRWCKNIKITEISVSRNQ